MNILVTTDLSESSKSAFAIASQYAKAFNAKVTLVAIIEDIAQAAMLYALDFPVFASPDIQRQLVEKVSTDVATLVKTHFAGVQLDSFVIEPKLP